MGRTLQGAISDNARAGQPAIQADLSLPGAPSLTSSMAGHYPLWEASELRGSEARYRVLADETSEGVFLVDGGSLRILDSNRGAASLTGYSQAELLGKSIRDLVPNEERPDQELRISRVSAQRSSISATRMRRQDGSLISVEIRQRRLEDGRILAVAQESGQRLLAESHLRQMLTGIDLFAATLDRESRISYANPAFQALTGWSADELLGRSIFYLLRAGPTADDSSLMAEGLAGANLHTPLRATLLTRSGVRLPVAVSTTALRDGAGRSIGTALLGQDVSAENASVTALEGQLRERAEVAAALGRLQPGESIEETSIAICRELCGLSGVDISCVVAFEADGGATVLAYEAPPEFGIEGGTRLPDTRAAYLMERAALGAWSEPWQARGEDGDYGEALTAARVQSASYAPIRHGDSTLGVVVVVSLGSEDPGLAAEASPLPTISEFGATASALLARQLHADRFAAQLRRELGDIIDAGALWPVFQPIIDLSSGRVVGYEALTRFADGVAPDLRFATAWSVGLGAELETAALKAAVLAGRRLPPGRWLDLNVSPRLLSDPQRLRAALRGARRPLVIEITEHEIITDYRSVRQALSELGGVRTAVDDAGAGTANFAHVIELQPDFVKLDIGMVHGIDTDLARQAMMVAMRHFARATGCRLIAEGVETRAEAETVKALGAGFGQGYWYGRPGDVDALATAARSSAGRGPAKRPVRVRARLNPSRSR